MKETLRRLRAGGIVTLFPEGTRSRDGELAPLKPGIAVLVQRAGVPVVPVGLAGTFEVWPRSRLLPVSASDPDPLRAGDPPRGTRRHGDRGHHGDDPGPPARMPAGGLVRAAVRDLRSLSPARPHGSDGSNRDVINSTGTSRVSFVMASHTARARDLLSAATADHRGRSGLGRRSLAGGERAGRRDTRTRAAAPTPRLPSSWVSIRARSAARSSRSSRRSRSPRRPDTGGWSPGSRSWSAMPPREARSKDLGKRFRDAGISVESAIGFFEWIVDDPARRRKGLESARRSMELVRQVGGQAAGGAAGRGDRSRDARPAQRRRALSRTCWSWATGSGSSPRSRSGDSPGRSGRLGEAAIVAMEADHPSACILPDVYHLHRGGSGLGGVKLLSPRAIHVFHFNDYPAESAPREADRCRPRLSRRRRRPRSRGVAPGPGRGRVPA